MSLATMPFAVGVGGERISRHNALRDAIFDTAAQAGLAPTKEGRFLLPGADRRPADVLLPHWVGGQDGALDVTVVHPFQDATLVRAATEPGFALTFAHERKVRGADAGDRALPSSPWWPSQWVGGISRLRGRSRSSGVPWLGTPGSQRGRLYPTAGADWASSCSEEMRPSWKIVYQTTLIPMLMEYCNLVHSSL